MERKRKRKHKKKQHHDDDDDVAYCAYILLATTISTSSYNNSHETKFTLVKNCLTKLHFHFSHLSHSSLPISHNLNLPQSQPSLHLLSLFLALFPSLFINFNPKQSPKIASLTLHILGAASLLSFQTNQLIALDDLTLKTLVSALSYTNSRVSIAACDALMDLSTTPLGTQRLFRFSALQRLIFEFFEIGLCLDLICMSTQSLEKRLAFESNSVEVEVSLLHAAITLINMSRIEQLEEISIELVDEFLGILRRIWSRVYNQMLVVDGMNCSQENCLYVSNIRVRSLVECIFRLSLIARPLFTPMSSMFVRQCVFGSGESSFCSFLSDYWESSPTLVRKFCRSSIEEDDIFGSFARSLNCKDSSPLFLSSMLRSFVSCPPIASLEFDVLSFLEEVRDELGLPIIYRQDVRVVRTEKESKMEVHYFNKMNLDSSCARLPYVFTPSDIMKCEEAYLGGYTIAVRGMECRFPWVATIADALASLFGQPSIGVNMYLTPSNSQGLARHRDDHCVFVCQLFGSKQWTLFPRPNSLLPRLYDRLDSEQSLDTENSLPECREFLLQEGDILYIPRGVSHEACTGGRTSDPSQFSLHLTFGIEVEPPLEWEGFAHVALYCWSCNRKWNSHTSAEKPSGYLSFMSVNMLHALIELIGETDPIFRTACLVDVLQSTPVSNGLFCMDQKAIFKHLIQKISAGPSFLDVLRKVEAAVERNEDPLRRIRWLSILYREKEVMQEITLQVPFMEFETVLPSYVKKKETAEASFMQVKTMFCNEILYEDVIDLYKALLQKYMKARKQYKNSMLALHLN